ncbi:zinc-binding alcohol dehydrogenase family protein [Alicyclobacillus fastidiosus]|uniref:Zinc-binding alcohol dehydrogenase family protein n=1 Tax=Alicyclobacillus fastidiosus TaxID=392011 RepID=A0ABY6ZCF8_9BACL|nr:zinc-binding alcohol dehydrogenase family protein [Alicyclobacillus fastidiosus]WAH40532.1 zinc-binding alcohol dehydrogenase family protein [Alicyclobacillus fastidiosus]GMA61962.1 alcohol dehydrogenase [Alicyclobacillus fastidiosus]
MQGVVCRRPNELVRAQLPEPTLSEGQAIVRIRRIGVCGTDIHAYRGRQPYFTYPRILGHELAGEVVEVGENPYGIESGDLVTLLPYFSCGKCIACKCGKPNCCTEVSVFGVHEDGGMREYVSVPVEYVVKAEGLTLDELATVECFSIGAHAVRRANLVPGERVLVIGGGPIGLGVMKFAKLAGADVTAMDINRKRLEFCEDWAGPNRAVLASERAIATIREITNLEFPTAVFDATGNAQSMMSAIGYLAHGGRLIYVGLVQADITFSDPEFHKRETTLISSRNATIEDFHHVIHELKGQHLDASTFITHRADLKSVVATFDDWTKPESNVVKAMIEA